MLASLSSSLSAQLASPQSEKPSAHATSLAETYLAKSHLSSNAPPPISNVQLGLSGFWKLGYPTHTMITVSASVGPLSNARIDLESVDADGVGVIYQAGCQIEPMQNQTITMTTQHGRAAREMRVRLWDNQDQLIAERTVYEVERGTALPVEQPWIVGIGSDMALEQAAMRSAKGLLPSYSSCEVSDTSKLPRMAQAYEGVDLLVISTRDWTIIESLSPDQQSAIVNWVQGGGHALVWLGENAERVREQSWLAQLIQAEVQGTVKRVDPGMLESYLSSQKRLDPLTCSRLAPDQCVIDLSLSSHDRQKLPLVYRSAFGLGQVHVFAADLDTSPLREWPERKLLLERLYREHANTNRESATKAIDQAHYLGYTDLSGQIHAALDLFRTVRIGSLTLIAIVLVGIAALLGPFDYFVISKAWRKPSWTWISLLLWSIATLLGVAMLARFWKPAGLALNSIELIDVDYSTSWIRGRGFAHCYAGNAGRFKFSATARDILSASSIDLASPINNGSENREKAARRTQLSWCGQPGYGLGGFDSDVRTDIGFPPYRVDGVDLVDVGINFAGTKSIRADWAGSIKNLLEHPHFTVTGNSEFLQGKWTNPMDQDLLDGWLLYRSWLYPLPSRVRAHGIHQISASDNPKDLGRRLQRRQLLQDRDSSLPWDATDRKDIARLVEMLTLYQAGGGAAYTGLSHQYWDDLDMSEHLKLNRVIVFGRLAEPWIDWSAQTEATPIEVRDENRSAYIRFVIPVTVAN